MSCIGIWNQPTFWSSPIAVSECAILDYHVHYQTLAATVFSKKELWTNKFITKHSRTHFIWGKMPWQHMKTVKRNRDSLSRKLSSLIESVEKLCKETCPCMLDPGGTEPLRSLSLKSNTTFLQTFGVLAVSFTNWSNIFSTTEVNRISRKSSNASDISIKAILAFLYLLVTKMTTKKTRRKTQERPKILMKRCISSAKMIKILLSWKI